MQALEVLAVLELLPALKALPAVDAAAAPRAEGEVLMPSSLARGAQ